MSNSDLKLVGKLGLDLNRLKKDVGSMETIINEANKHSKTLGQTWQSMGRDMEKAFKNVNISDLAMALEKLEKAHKNGLNKMLDNAQKFQADDKRKNDAHQATLLIKQQESNAKIENAKLKSLQTMDIQMQKFQNAEIRSTESHNLKLQNVMEQHAARMNKINQALSPSGFSNNANVMLDYALKVGGIVGVTASFKEAIAVNKEFETGQINLQRVLGATDSEMRIVKQTTLDVAKATGNSFKDIQEIQNLWIRLGQADLSNLKELSQLTAIGLNVAGFKDAADSVSYLVAAVNQMANGDLSKAPEVLDSWAKIADYTAVKTTEDLAEVISRAGAQGKQLGLTFHDLNAITAVLMENISTNGDKLGTALKTVFSRIQDPKNYEVIEKWGVKVTEIGESGKLTFRNLIDIMDDLNKKFKDLSADDYKTAMAEIVQALSGTNHSVTINTLIDKWDRYAEIVEISLNSSGYAMEQNEKIMQSFEKQVEVLKATLVELALSIGENGLMGVMLGLVQGTQKAVDWFNNLNPNMKNAVIVGAQLVALFGTLNLALSKTIQFNIAEHILKITKNFVLQKAAVNDVAKAEIFLNDKVKKNIINETQRELILKSLKIGKKADVTATKAQIVAEEAYTMATAHATMATIAFNAAITAGLFVIPFIIGLFATYSRTLDEVNQHTLEHIKNMQDEINETENLIKEYEELTEKASDNAYEKERIEAIEARLISLYPQAVTGIEDETDALKKQISVIKDLTREKKESMLAEAKLFRDANQTAYKNSLSAVAEYEKKRAIDIETLNNGYYAQEYGAVFDDEALAQYHQKLDKDIADKKDFVENYNKNNEFILALEKDLSTPPRSPEETENKHNTYFDPNEFSRSQRELQYKYNTGKINNDVYANELQSLLDAYKDNITEQEAWSLEEQIYRLHNQKDGSGKTDKNSPYNKAHKEIAHRYKMGKLTLMQYANELETLFNKYENSLNLDEKNKAEEEIYNLRQSNIGKLPEDAQKKLDDWKYFSAIGELKDIDFAELVDGLMAEYENELDEKAMRSLTEFSYNLKMKVKPDIEDIDYEQFQKIMREQSFELTKLQKQEELMNLAIKNKVDLYPILMQKIELYTKNIEELNKANAFYITALEDVNRQIEELDPTSLKYEESLKILQKQQRELTSEIQKNTTSLYDNQIAIEKTKAQMEDYVKASLKETYSLQHKMAEQEFESRHKSALEKIKQEEEAYLNALDNRKSAKQKELDMMQEQIKQQEYLNSLTEIKDKIAKVKANTRFAYIDEETGKEIYTYDRAKVAELEKELNKKVESKQQDEAKQHIQDEIKHIDEQKRIAKESYDERYKLQQEAQDREKKHFNEYWRRRLSDEYLNRATSNLIEKEGYEDALLISQSYYDDVKNQYDNSCLEAYEGGKSITENLSKGLFEEIDSIIQTYKDKISGINSSSFKGSGISYKNENAANSVFYGNDTGVPISSKGSISLREKEISSTNYFRNLPKHHNGGFVGGYPLNNQHERIAKLLDGELVLSLRQLDRLSLSLPQMTYNTVDTHRQEQAAERARPIVIQIDKLTSNDFDGFMKSIEPYISSHK